MRIVHLSDIHVWRIPWSPIKLLNKRLIGVLDLARGRARKFRLERLRDVVAHVQSLAPDHLLITGDLTTTALPEEFEDALEGLAPLLADPARVSVVPGNHDRYTWSSARNRLFEKYFGVYMPGQRFPWVRMLDTRTAILGLDPTRSHISARGFLPPRQMAEADALRAALPAAVDRLIIACHYPIDAPAPYRRELAIKRLKNQSAVAEWLAGWPPHLLCCGHVHAAWAQRPDEVPGQLCLNAGAPLYRDRHGRRRPGFLEIRLEDASLTAVHHGWCGQRWNAATLVDSPLHFARPASESTAGP